MVELYQLQPLIGSELLRDETVTSLCWHRDQVFVGCQSGSLLVFDVQGDSSNASLSDKHQRFSQKAIDQLAVLQELNAIVCLSGGDVALYSLPSLDLVSNLSSQTKAMASYFALRTFRHRTDKGTELQSVLAIACRRKLLVLSWTDGNWNPSTEVNLPHQIRGMDFVETGAKRYLTAGFSTGEYGSVSLGDLANGEQPTLSELSVPSKSGTDTPSSATGSPVQASGSAFRLAKASGLGSFGLGTRKVEKNFVATVTAPTRSQNQAGSDAGWLDAATGGWENASDETVVVGQDPYVSLAQPKGLKVLQQRRVTGTLQDLCAQGPFVFSLSVETNDATATTPGTSSLSIAAPDDFADVQLLKPSSNLQTRLLARASHSNVLLLSKDIGKGDRIDLLRSEPLEQALSMLEDAGQWRTALRVLRRSSESVGPATMHKYAMLRALDLFKRHSFDLAISLFIQNEANAAKVVALYEEMISGSLHVDVGKQETLFGVRETSTSSTTVGSAPVRPPSPVKKDASDSASVRSSAGSVRGDHGQQATRSPQKREPSQVQKVAKATFNQAVDELVRFLTDRRQKYAQAIAALLPSSRPSPAQPPSLWTRDELFGIADVPLSKLDADQLAQVAQVVDTALFRCYLATKPVLVGPLSRIENWCRVEDVENLLMEANKWRELLDMYRGKRMHAKALDLLKKQNEGEEDPKERVQPTVDYLQKLGPDQLELIFKSAAWVFEQDEASGLQIFLAETEEVESLPRHRCMTFLDSVDSDACRRYLEHIINDLSESGTDFNEKLLTLYLDRVRADGQDEETRSKLRKLLESSQSYRPERVLGRLPSDDLYDLRAIVLGRLGRHEGALQIYTEQLQDTKAAERYCRRVANETPQDGPTVFRMLLKKYLRPSSTQQTIKHEAALSLIASQATFFDTIDVFDLLPPLASLAEIRTFLEKSLRLSRQKTRERLMVRNVAKSLLESQEMDVMKLEERRVKITESRICPHCHRRLGNSVIAIHSPLGEVTHYQCREKYIESKQQARISA